MENNQQIITLNEQYSAIIDQGAATLNAVEAQVTLASWGAMKIVHDTCDEAYRLLDRYGVAGRGKWREQEKLSLSSMSKTYKDLAEATEKSVTSIQNAYNWYGKTLEFIGDEEEVLSLILPPSVAGAIVTHKKLDNEKKSKLLEIAIKKKLTVSQVRTSIKKLIGEEEEDPVFKTNLWRVKSPDQKYGAIYPGRLPGQIAYNILHHYSSPGDMCFFPFVGSGTEADVAKYMGRKYFAWDLHYVEDVEKRHKSKYFVANSLTPWQITEVIEEKADLVFADPPRFMWGNGTWEDADAEHKYNISNQAVDEFVDSMELIGRNAYMALNNGGKFAILLRQPGFVNIPNGDLTFELMQRFSQFEFVNRLSISFPTTAYRPDEKGKFANECMDLLVLEKR